MKNRFLFLVGIGALLAMSSCSKDEENLVVKSGEPATLTLTIKGSDLSTKATVLPSDLATAGESFDNKINNIVVGVFRSTGEELAGYADAIGDVQVSEVTASNPRAFSIPSGKEIKVTAGKRDIIVVANASTADINELKTATTKSDFMNKVLVLGDKEQSKDKLLMTGESDNVTVNKGDGNSFPIKVTRLVARVQLTGLKSSFISSYSNATLDIDEIFLHNALFGISVNNISPSSKILYTGWTYPSAPTSNYYSYLADFKTPQEPLYTLGASTSNVINQNHYFYTFENQIDATTPDYTTATKLVISGTFYPNGKPGTSSYRVYYPIVVNKDVVSEVDNTGKGILRNYVYSISATIFRPGVADPNKPLDPASISLTITVANWVELPQQNNDL